MDIKVSVENGSVPVTVMQVSGNIDANSYQEFQTKADELIAGGARNILIDLSHAPFVSSAGLRALHHIFNRLRDVNPSNQMSEEDVRRGISAGTYTSPNLKLLHLSRETRTTFQMTGFDMFIETYDDREAALASFHPAS